MKFENDWLDRYLRPEGCIHDNGGQFTGVPFMHMLVLNGIKDLLLVQSRIQKLMLPIFEFLHQSISYSL